MQRRLPSIVERLLPTLVVAACAGSAYALPPDEHGRGLVDGANHRIGDASFVQRFGVEPSPRTPEALRMRTHLEFMRSELGRRAATRPELEARRRELLGYLDDYIAKGTTPWNLDRPWRTPVFVDALGNVCAVGYLIERSAGRALVEAVAARHRFDFLDDITMPEVSAWISESGFTLDELASIQPGYAAPIIETWSIWDLDVERPSDGPWQVTIAGVTTRGSWHGGQMHGAWSRSDADGRLIGHGEFERGRGTWTSLAPDGRELAEGAFLKSLPEGRWRFFHPSGLIAAEGSMKRGQRSGRWTFYYDRAPAVPIAKGRFAHGGRVSGTWRHFDQSGAQFASTWTGPRSDWGDVLRMRMATHDGLRHEIAEGNFGGDYSRVDALALEGTRLYVDDWFDSNGDPLPVVHDARGRVLVKREAGWERTGCDWPRSLARAAERGHVEQVLAGIRAVERDGPPLDGRCAWEMLDPVIAARVDRMLAASRAVRVPTPAFVRALTAGEPQGDGTDAAGSDAYLDDLGQVIARAMTWYIEWPHIDGAFARVFATLPGHYPPDSLLTSEGDGVVEVDAASDRVQLVSLLPAPGLGTPPRVRFR